MKNIILILSTILIVCSCNSRKSENQSIQKINPNDIQPGGVVNDSLSSNQVEKIKKIHATFSEVYSVSLEETFTNFKRDQDPDSEIDIWLQMADAYQKYLGTKKNSLDLNTRKEVFKLLLSRSMMSDEEALSAADLILLTEQEAREVLRYYTAPADPIDVVKNP